MFNDFDCTNELPSGRGEISLDPKIEEGLPGISKLPMILKSVPRNLYHQPNMACSMCSFYRIAVLIEV